MAKGRIEFFGGPKDGDWTDDPYPHQEIHLLLDRGHPVMTKGPNVADLVLAFPRVGRYRRAWYELASGESGVCLEWRGE